MKTYQQKILYQTYQQKLLYKNVYQKINCNTFNVFYLQYTKFKLRYLTKLIQHKPTKMQLEYDDSQSNYSDWSSYKNNYQPTINSNSQNSTNNLFIHQNQSKIIKKTTYLNWKDLNDLESNESSNRNFTNQLEQSQQYSYGSVLSSCAQPESYLRILRNHKMIEAKNKNSRSFYKRDNSSQCSSCMEIQMDWVQLNSSQDMFKNKITSFNEHSQNSNIQYKQSNGGNFTKSSQLGSNQNQIDYSNSNELSNKKSSHSSQSSKSKHSKVSIASLSSQVRLVCSICFQQLSGSKGCVQTPKQVATLSPCCHKFCLSCLSGWLSIKASCPLCRSPSTSYKVLQTITPILPIRSHLQEQFDAVVEEIHFLMFLSRVLDIRIAIRDLRIMENTTCNVCSNRLTTGDQLQICSVCLICVAHQQCTRGLFHFDDDWVCQSCFDDQIQRDHNHQ